VTVGELFLLFGLKLDGSWRRGIIAVEGLRRAMGGLIDLVEEAANVGQSISKMAEQTGLSAQTIQDFGYVAKQAGADSRQLATGIATFEKTLYAASTGSKKAAENVARLGLTSDDVSHALKDPDGLRDAVFKASDKLHAMGDTAERAGLKQLVFGRRSAAAANALDQGSDALKRQIEHFHALGGALSDEEVQNLKNLKTDMNDVEVSLRGLANQAIASLAPALSKMLKSLTEWLVAHRELLQKVLLGAVNALAIAFTLLGKAVDVVAKIVGFLTEHWVETAAIVMGLATAFIALRVAAMEAFLAMLVDGVIAAAPFVLIGVLIGALILIFNDLWVGLTGGRSVIIDFFKALIAEAENSDSAIGKVVRKIEKLVDALKRAYNFIHDIATTNDDPFQKTEETHYASEDDRYYQYRLKTGGYAGELRKVREDMAQGINPRGFTSTPYLTGLDAYGRANYQDADDLKRRGLRVAGEDRMTGVAILVPDNSALTMLDPWAHGRANSSVHVDNVHVHTPPGANAKEYADAVEKALVGVARNLAAVAPGGKAR